MFSFKCLLCFVPWAQLHTGKVALKTFLCLPLHYSIRPVHVLLSGSYVWCYACVCACAPEEDTRSHYRWYEPSHDCWELNLRLVEERLVLLTSESSLQSPAGCSWTFFCTYHLIILSFSTNSAIYTILINRRFLLIMEVFLHISYPLFTAPLHNWFLFFSLVLGGFILLSYIWFGICVRFTGLELYNLSLFSASALFPF